MRLFKVITILERHWGDSMSRDSRIYLAYYYDFYVCGKLFLFESNVMEFRMLFDC